MQKIRPKQVVEQNVTLSTSVQSVQTLLETAIGCISYLRGLFQDDNFYDSKIEAPRVPISTLNPASTSKQLEDKKNAPITLKVKKLSRGISNEADKLIDYLEVGALDALQKSYLHQLLLAIYLDPDEPTNLVECYTFTFTYSIDSQGNKHPKMIVRDKISGRIISGNISNEGFNSPVKEGHLKRQIQKLIKNLIASTQALDELPRRRFINVRLYFTDDAPEDYQPPCFRPVEASDTYFRMTTSKVDEVPDLATLGSISTGFHGVTLQMVSIAPLLEVPFDEGVTAQECLTRNKLDASTRRVEWNANELVALPTIDSEGKQVDIVPLGIMDDNGVLRTVEEVEISEWKDLKGMVGIRSGDINEADEEERQKLIFAKGEKERIAKMNAAQLDNDALLAAIEARKLSIDLSQVASTQISPVVSRQRSTYPPVPLFFETKVQQNQVVVTNSSDSLDSQVEEETELETPLRLQIGKEVLEDIVMEEETRDESNKGGEASPPNTSDPMELGYHTSSINSFIIAEDETQYPDMSIRTSVAESSSQKTRREVFARETITRSRLRETTAPIELLPPLPATSKSRKSISISSPEEVEEEEDFGSACECGDKSESDAMVFCSTCKYWKHVVCYGYLNSDDSRMPEEFICYPCIAKAGTGDSLLNSSREGEVEKALTDLQSLALFRRAIESLRSNGAENMKALSERLGTDASTAAQVIKRLRIEKFTIEVAKNIKFRNRNAKNPPGNQTVVNESKEQKRYGNDKYFNPGKGAELEARLILDYTEDDAEGEPEELSRKSTRNRSLTKEGTPNQPSTTAINPLNPIKAPHRVATVEDDPIINDEEDESPTTTRKSRVPLQTVAQVTTTTTMISPPNRKQVPAPYIPSFNKGKGKATMSSNSLFHRASSTIQNLQPTNFISAGLNLMEVDEEEQRQQETRYDESGPGPRTLEAAATFIQPVINAKNRSPSGGKRKRDETEMEESRAGSSRRKKQKCSEADQLEI